jgi:hypothetical protein
VADRVQQVGFAAARSAMNEERVEADRLAVASVLAAVAATSFALPMTNVSNR